MIVITKRDAEIKLRVIRNTVTGPQYAGATIRDSDILHAIGAPRYFNIKEYDEVLIKAAKLGISIAAPPETK